MNEKLKMISELSDYPFLFYQERICIYDSAFQNYEVIQQFSEIYWEEIPENTICFYSIDTLLFSAVKFYFHESAFVFCFVFPKEILEKWPVHSTEILQNRMSAIVTLLSSDSKLAIENPLCFETEASDLQANKERESYYEEVDFSNNYQFEKAVIHQLKLGNIGTLEKMIAQLSSINSTRLAENKLTQFKYRIVSFIALLTRASINYGCSPTLSYRLSDQLIRRMDKIANQKDLSKFMRQMMLEFSLLMQAESIPQTSLVVKQAVQMIHQNVYESITLEQIADSIGVTPSYLSTLFKKTMSLSLTHYINKTKIEEAKYLLAQTDISYADISEMLRYSSQSYFGMVFKNWTEMTPKEYRTTES